MPRPIMAEAKRSGEPGWSWRKAFIFPVVTYACYRLTMMESAPDTQVNQLIAWIWGANIIAGVFIYTGFATFQDVVAIWATRTGLPYATPPVAIDGEATQDQSVKDERG
ncbi:hypothetical protein PPF1_34 [Rhizobium phage vB_RleM_PPF1]|uniref:hypothetical protein n=1 Tax=Rhizobium phage vB_RleM_PPF1 TaxID=1498228 RepID=UPI00049B0E0B|nr:hypothetical protein PPF1_34 [Rhizobium phage vB_RleM_PPF1]AID18347.1 hypothetical protein PPF1_34 [Rhizobium phage vB_RleM_PPF1]